jgi:precorrin-6B methylase 2
MSNSLPGPSPVLFFETVNSHQRTAAVKAAVDLDVFSAIAAGADTAPALAKKCGAAERGVRILCDYLTILGFLTKQDARYVLTEDASVFLVRGSPAYMGGILEFLLAPGIVDGFKDLAAAVRNGGTVVSAEGTMEPEHPVWVKFARAMVPMMGQTAQLMAQLVAPMLPAKAKVLDIAAGHGMFGIALARSNPTLELVAQDWANVIEVAKENAAHAGLGERFRSLPGDAFKVDFGGGYDAVLLPNFLHHFDRETCESLLRKVHAALKPGGVAVTIEFVPNEDRVSPPPSAGFALIMLATTARGDAYPFSELERMFKNAGFAKNELHALTPSAEHAIISRKVM